MTVFLMDTHLISLFFSVESLGLKEQTVVSESECLKDICFYV